MERASVPVNYARLILRNAVARGLDPNALLRRSRISPRLMSEPGARISVPAFANLQSATMVAMNDEGLGYEPRARTLGSWKMMTYAVIGSRTLGQALHRYCRFFGLFDFGLRPVMINDSHCTRIRLLPAPGETHHYEDFAYEFALYNLYRFASWLVEEHPPLIAVRLHFPQPEHAQAYRDIFVASPIIHNAEHTELVLQTPLLDLALVQNEHSLSRFLRHPVLSMLMQRYAKSSWTVRVRRAIGENMIEVPPFDALAGQLNVHPQTLRRRLADEGITFKELKQQLRRDVALHHLVRGGMSIADIAERTGFSESSAFIRAFKGWTGTTPYTYRKGL